MLGFALTRCVLVPTSVVYSLDRGGRLHLEVEEMEKDCRKSFAGSDVFQFMSQESIVSYGNTLLKITRSYCDATDTFRLLIQNLTLVVSSLSSLFSQNP